VRRHAHGAKAPFGRGELTTGVLSAVVSEPSPES
jgi:hypothetical protein